MKTKLALTTSILALALGASPIMAAPIHWTAHDISAGNGTTDVSTAGTLVDARNGGTSDVVVNGVTFLSVANSGNLFDSLFANDNITTRAGSSVTNSAGSNYYSFLQLGQRSGRVGQSTPPRIEPTEVWTTVNFTGLTVGNSYQVQIWASDTNTTAGDAGNKGLLLGNGSAGDPDINTDTMIVYEHDDGPGSPTYGLAGQYGIGYFVADATTQSFNVRGYNNLLTTPSAGSQDHFSNGWQIRDQGVDTSPPSPAPTVATLTPFEDRVDIEVSTTTTDQTGVEYRYNRRSISAGAIDFTSPWQDGTSFTDTGLSASTQYFYTVEARDKTPTQYTTPESAEVPVTTLDPDNTDPEPATMSFAVVPTATSYDTITMTAVTATDFSGVEYFFDETTGNPGGDDSGWQDSPVYTDTGLSPNTTYTYTVQARDKSVANNTNTASSAESATTDFIGTATITWGAPANITDNVTDVSTNGTLHDARTGGATRTATVNGVTFESVADSGDLFTTRFAIDTVNASFHGGVTDAAYRDLLRDGQRSANSSSPNPWTQIEFFGLTAGNTYEVQFWVSDNRSAADDRATVLGNGDGDSPDPANSSDAKVLWESSTGIAGQYVIGTFVANANNQAFNVRTWNSLLTTPAAQNATHFGNAWQIRDLGVVSGSPFGNWAAGPWSGTLGDTNPNLDFDGGGLDTGIEWVVGGDPTDASDDAGNAPTSDNSDPDFFIFTFNRRDAANTDGNTNIAVEYGSDLSGWTTAVHDGTDVIITPTDNGAFDSVEVKLRRSILAPGGKFFARLKVVVSTP